MKIKDFRSGHYEERYQYRAFLPARICHEWEIPDPELTELLGRADRALGELNAFAQLIPDIDVFIQMYVAKEATQSTRIEGAQTNIEDAFKAADQIDPEERDDWAEVQDYIRAISYSIDALEKLPLSNRLLRNTHKVLMSGARGKHKLPGQFRTSQNWIGVSLKNAVFIPPHHEHVPDLMGDLEAFLNADNLYTHPLVRIAISHYQFETIHPFLDGNGRLGRLLISLYLASEGLLAKPNLYLSDYFERNKTAYADHMMAVREGNQLREWLIFFFHGVQETAVSAAQVCRLILATKERIERDILPRFGIRKKNNALTLMRYLYEQPVVNVKTAASVIGSTANTASALINDLVMHGVLTEITGMRRDRLFVFEEYLGHFRAKNPERKTRVQP